ncbi:MAG: transcriptional repressor [Methylotenera sp.]|nr:transcriptional repressor [Oligoflexia bacterium]
MKVLSCGRQAPDTQTSGAANAAQRKKATSHWAGKLAEHIREQDLNHSRSREDILQQIVDFDRHFTLPELLKKVQEKFPSIGSATVYRSIPLFVAAGILQESLADQDKLSVYELGEGAHHDHIVCLKCGTIFEFHDESIEVAQEKLISKLGFKAVRHHHVIYADCLKAR